MANTRGFDIVAEASVSVLKELMVAAWESGGSVPAPGDCTPQKKGTSPQSYPIPPDPPGPSGSLGGVHLAGGEVQIPVNELDLTMDTDPTVNGVNLKFGLHIQVKIDDPLVKMVPSAKLFDLTADVHAEVPIDLIPPSQTDVGILFNDPRVKVTTTLTSGDPIDSRLETFIGEYIHSLYKQGGTTFPHKIALWNQEIGLSGIKAYLADAVIYISDDASDPARQITVTRLNANMPNQAVRISIPILLILFNIRPQQTSLGPPPPLADMGVETRIQITAPLPPPPLGFNNYILKLSAVTQNDVDTSAITPAPGDLGAHYTTNKKALDPLLQFLGLTGGLDDLLKIQVKQQGRQMVQNMVTNLGGDPKFPFFTKGDVEGFIGAQFKKNITDKGSWPFWPPSQSSGVLGINNVKVKALADALVIAINATPGADVNAITNFIPAGRNFSIAVSATKVLAMIDQSIHRPVAEGGFGPDFPNTPATLPEVDGHEAELTRLDRSLIDGAIHLEGDVTVFDVTFLDIDIDASFEVDCGLKWKDTPDGQEIERDCGKPDIDLSLFGWIVSFLLGFISFGLVGGIIGLVVMLIVENIAQSIGGPLVTDNVTKQVTGLGAWPKDLKCIGTMQSHFTDPIGISPEGLVFSGGGLHPKSAFALVPKVFAKAQGPYMIAGGSALTLSAGQTDPAAIYKWDLGDGASATTPSVNHTYAKAGIYIAELGLTVNLPGGNFSRQFALVKVENTPPVVQAPPDQTINEGDKVTFSATFTDKQWPDKHHAVWIWDDYQGPSPGVVVETNTPPAAQGTVTGSHAWGHSGIYNATVLVQDDQGGVGWDTFKVTVLNVPPTVDAGPPMFAYPCSVITLEGKFTDPSWLDTHTGSWDFGDCTAPLPAIIQETHNPPVGKGVAFASHIYHCCGTYQAICTIIDDEGGVGRDTTVAQVVDVANADFEKGFRSRLLGVVANNWEPYIAAPPELLGTPPANVVPGTYFAAEKFKVHGGERSQHIFGEGRFRAGIYQQIGANPSWDYQISVWYSISERMQEKKIVSSDPAIKAQQEGIARIRAAGTARLGIDPQGGTDPTAPSVVWSAGLELLHWTQLSVRAGAVANAITIFLEAIGEERVSHEVYFDDVVLIPIQPFCAAEPPPKPQTEKVCLDFTDLRPFQEIPSGYSQNGFTVRTPDKQPRRIVTSGPPAGQNKLELGVGVIVVLPYPADEVEIEESQMGFKPIEITAFDAQGFPVAQTTSKAGTNILQTLKLQAAGMVSLEIKSKGTEALLIRVCASRSAPAPEKGKEK
jgi:hypothetical protein